MYSLYDLYNDLLAGRKSSFQYNEKEFYVNFSPIGGPVFVSHHLDGKKWCRATTQRRQVSCMTDLQGYAACLLHEKKDLWFDRHGEYCTKEEFTGVVTKKQQDEDDLEKIINSVLDIDTDDKCPL